VLTGFFFLLKLFTVQVFSMGLEDVLEDVSQLNHTLPTSRFGLVNFAARLWRQQKAGCTFGL